MMGALLKLVEVLPFDYFLERMKEDLSRKFCRAGKKLSRAISTLCAVPSRR